MKFSTSLVILSFVFLVGLVTVYCERDDHRCGAAYGSPSCGDGRCCSVHGWCGGSAAYCRKPGCDYQCWTVADETSLPRAILRNNNRNNNNAISEIICEPLFNEMFKHRKDCPSQGFYSYEAFVTAASSFPGFGTTGDVATCKRELAAFLGQISTATTGEWSDSVDAHSWGLCHINTTTVGGENDYCISHHWPCASGKKYTSRGPIQLIYNSNYGLAGEALGLDLINDPDLVATDSVVSFKTAIWFWMTQHDNKPSCHDILINANSGEVSQVPSYDVISNIIKSGLGTSTTSTASSIEYYKRYCDMLEVSYGNNLKYWYDETPNFSESARIQMPVL